jgi:DNA-binding XRE family transcriptional regulator
LQSIDAASDQGSKVDKAKRKCLEAKGWKVGSVAKFLGLSEQESALIEIKLALSYQLRQRRKKQMTQAELAQRIRSSQPRIAKAEGGSGSVSLDLLVRAMLATGATPQDIGKAIAGATEKVKA